MEDYLKTGTKEYYDSELMRLEHSKLSEKTKREIRKFLNRLENVEELSYNRLYFHSINLRILGGILGDSFLSPDSDDITQALANLRKKNLSEWTIEGYKASLKKFYNSIGKQDAVKDVKFKSKNKINYKRKPDWRISQEELDLLIRACDNARDKAIISMLFDSGIRIGELLTLKIKDAVFDDYGMKVMVSGKTGIRNVRVIGDSIGYVKAWLNVHPDTFNQEAWLFCGIGHYGKKEAKAEFNTGDPMFHQQIYAMLRKVKVRAVNLGFPESKKINPHKFRHNRATELAPKLPPVVLDKEMGWNLDSKMPAVYVHLNDEEVDNAYLEANGIHVEKSVKAIRKTRTCLRCKTVNPGNSEYCLQCGSPLDYNRLKQFEENQKKIESTLTNQNEISPEVQAVLKNIPESEKTVILSAIVKSLLDQKKA